MRIRHSLHSGSSLTFFIFLGKYRRKMLNYEINYVSNLDTLGIFSKKIFLEHAADTRRAASPDTPRTYQIRPCSLPPPYLLLVYTQGLGREEVGSRGEFEGSMDTRICYF